ncbi:MAG: CapA family protein [Vulcanibacillus sp.]
MLILMKIFLFISIFLQSITYYFDPPQARVMVVGDIMMHSPIINSGYDSLTKEYNYDDIFEKVKPIFSQADLVIGNLETPLAGEKIGYSGYPRFNSPDSLASSLKNAGFDVLTTANNHSMDQWEQGVVGTLNALDSYNIFHTGTFRSEEESEENLIINVNGIKIGLIAYTYGTNGLPVPEDKPYMVNLLDMDNISRDVNSLRSKGADYILAMIHYGDEYIRLPNQDQIYWTNEILASGVDFVLGSHPHVVQPLLLLNDNKQTTDKGAIYSLGNFLSDQRWDWKDYGIILDLLIEKNYWTGKMILKDVSAIPLYVDISTVDGKRKYVVLPLKDNISEVDKKVWDNGMELMEHVFNNGGIVIND